MQSFLSHSSLAEKQMIAPMSELNFHYCLYNVLISFHKGSVYVQNIIIKSYREKRKYLSNIVELSVLGNKVCGAI